jgi:uncharacterized membrane protein YoaK (UPF0700 family)
MRKKDIREAVRDFGKYLSTLPKNKLERKFEMIYRSVWLGFFALLSFALREGVILVFAMMLVALWLVYQMATGK